MKEESRTTLRGRRRRAFHHIYNIYVSLCTPRVCIEEEIIDASLNRQAPESQPEEFMRFFVVGGCV